MAFFPSGGPAVSDKIFQALLEMAVTDLAAALAASEGLSETDALAAVYHSSFYDRLADARSGLCTDSTASLVHLFLKQRRARPAT